ncbi:MAG: DUF1667 domain-containing protein [Solobacterium sp.]|nr:DUF1667 domain-containing protein [Solobacterium sp.]
METKELICVNCPMGCRVSVTIEAGEVLSVTGNSCPRGEAYARQESIRPMRILTSTVKIDHALHRVLPVITSKDIPLDMMDAAMEEIRRVTVDAPVKMNDVLIENLLGTGADVIASRSMDRI